MTIEGHSWDAKNKKWIVNEHYTPPKHKGSWKKSGIYAIVVPAIKHVYIGQSVNITSRWSQHKHVLKHGRCEIEEMQKAWNSGLKFEFVIIEETSDELKLKEKACAEMYLKDGYQLFNSYFIIDAVTMFIDKENMDLFQKLQRLICRGKINRDELERYIDNI
jgi:hypothetical protein